MSKKEILEAKDISEKDFLIYDADCGFCQRSVQTLKKISKDKINYIASNTLKDGFYGISKDSTNSSIKFFEHREKEIAVNDFEKIQDYTQHTVHEDAVIYHGAYATCKALSKNSSFAFLLFLYEYVPLLSTLMEAAYRIIARNRQEISKNLGFTTCKIN